jgi:hypothetical protein
VGCSDDSTKKKVIRLGDEMAMKKREAKENGYGDQV